MASLLLTLASIGALSFLLGGWAWSLVAVLSLLSIVSFFEDAPKLAFSGLISLFWLAAFLFTDDRRLFFPFTIQFAVQAFAVWSLRSKILGAVAATGVVALFSVIRLIQSATLIVLLVELIVAGVALWIAAEYYRRGEPSLKRRLVAGGIGSVLAFCGLVF